MFILIFILLFHSSTYHDVFAKTHSTKSVKIKQILPPVIERVKNKYEKISNFKASFQQVNQQLNLNATKTLSGIVYYERPGKFRWESKESIIVSNYKTLWVYTISPTKDIPSQIMVSDSVKKSQPGSTVLFLENVSKLQKEFNFSEKLTTKDEVTFELTPKKEITGVEKINITVTRQTHFITAIEIFDALGNINKINLSSIETNITIDKKIFNFIPPKGVEIVRTP